MPQRVLIVKLGAIGDVCTVLPAARKLHESGATIDWLCGKTVAPLLACYPWIRAIVVDEHALHRSGKISALWEILRVWTQLIGTSFDSCVVLQFDARYEVLVYPVRARRKVRLHRENRSLNLVSERHHSAEYFRILCDRPDGFTAETFAPVKPDRLPDNPFPRTEKRRIALVPGGARNLLNDSYQRRWPVPHYRQAARDLLDRGFEVVLTGGPDDRWVNEEFRELEVINQIGAWSLPETVAFYESCDCVVTHDTGPMHLAGLTSCGLVSIFGPTSPSKFTPRRNKVIALWGGAHLACRPCYDGRTFAACPSVECMKSVTVDHVLAAVDRILTGPALDWSVNETG